VTQFVNQCEDADRGCHPKPQWKRVDENKKSKKYPKARLQGCGEAEHIEHIALCRERWASHVTSVLKIKVKP
jgi:hypothetical protein